MCFAGETGEPHALPLRPAQLLVECIFKGVSLNTKDKFGRTPLIRAAELGRLPFLKMILLCGAKVDVQDKAGWTALMRSAERGDMEMCKVLISFGAGVDLVNRVRGTRFRCTLPGLLTSYHCISQSGKTALMCAAQQKYHDVFLSILEGGASTTPVDSYAMGAWEWALAAPGSAHWNWTPTSSSDIGARSGRVTLEILKVDGEFEILPRCL